MHLTTTLFAFLCVATATFLLNGCGPPEPQATPPATEPAAPPELPDDPQAAAPEEVEAVATNDSIPTTEVASKAAPEQAQIAAPAESAVAQAESAAQPPSSVDTEEAQPRTVFYRADSAPAEMPPVVLSKAHEALCKVKVGDAMPAITLPQIGDGGQQRELSDLFGERATVVVFWRSDRRMAREQLSDLGPDVVQPFGKAGVAVAGIAVKESAESAQAALQKAGATFPNLLDADAKAFALVGSEKLPRTYLLDPDGKILWFDIEYSHATRRELNQALRAITGSNGPATSEAPPAADGRPASAGR